MKSKLLSLALLFVCGLLALPAFAQAPLPTFGSAAFNTGFNAQSRIPASGTLKFGSCRIWASTTSGGNLVWALLDNSTGTALGETSYNFAGLDSYLISVYNAAGGPVNCTMVLALTPANASGSSDSTCSAPNGSCHPPTDIGTTGTGLNLWWRNWVAAIASHVHAAGYSNTHAAITSWETWNEVDNSCSLNPAYTLPSCGANFWEGTYDQLQRMTEDARCIIKGGSQTITATGETCSQVQAAVNSVSLSGAVSPTDSIVLASNHATTSAGVAILQNELYCTASPKSGSSCSRGGVHASVDVINTHIKTCNQVSSDCTVGAYPSDADTIEAQMTTFAGLLINSSVLQPAELAKPIWIDEGGYEGGNGWEAGTVTGVYSVAQMQQSFFVRNDLIAFTGGFSLVDNYLYDISNAIDPAQRSDSSTLPLAGWNTAFTWLNNMAFGSVISGVPTANSGCAILTGNVWGCYLTNNTKNFLVMWDQSQSCPSGSCTTATASVPSPYAEYLDINGGQHSVSGSSVSLGAQPILLMPTSPACPDVINNAGYVLASATGAGTGADWANAYTSFGTGSGQLNPAAMVRGCTYYVGTGQYNLSAGTQFTTADSSTTTITIQAPTVASHGTGVGWSNAFVGMAVYGPMQFASDYWVMNGVYNSAGNINTIPFAPAGCPPANVVTTTNTYKWITCGATYPYTASGYGFKIMNGGATNCSTAVCNPISSYFFDSGLSILGNHITVEFVEVNGSMDQTNTNCDGGIGVNLNNGNAGGQHVTIQYVWSHDLGEGNYFDATNYLWLDHDWFQRAAGNGSCHGEMVGVRADTGHTYPTTNFTLSNSFVSNMGSSQTAYFNTPNSANTNYLNIYLFGNIFFCNGGESSTAGNCKTGNGFMYNELESSGSVTPFVAVNNDLDGGLDSEMYVVQMQLGFEGGGYVPTWNNPVIENNIWSNPANTNRILGFTCGGATLNSLTYAYNAYMGAYAAMGQYPTSGAAYGVNCPSATDTTASPRYAQLLTSNPYTNAGTSTAGANDYTLLANTNAGANLSSLTPPSGNIGVDMLGHARTTWSRGALEFPGPNTPSFSCGPPSTLPTGHASQITVPCIGVNTSWGGGTTFSISGGVAGAVLASYLNNSATSETLYFTTGSGTGNVTITDSADSASAIIPVAQAGFTMNPNSGATTSNITVTAHGMNTLWLSENPLTLFGITSAPGCSGQALAGSSISVSSNILATFTLTTGTAACTITVQDDSTTVTAPFTVSATATAPTVTAGTIGSITNTSAVMTGASFTCTGGCALPISAVGACYSTSPNPALGTATCVSTGSTSPWNNTLGPLLASTLYYVRNYATNSVGTGYSSNVTFTTMASEALEAVIVSSGTVFSSPAGISFLGPGSASANFPQGSNVTLTATPSAGYSFSGWSGACSGGTCTLTMNSALSATATFTKSSQTPQLPNVWVNNNEGNVAVTAPTYTITFPVSGSGGAWSCGATNYGPYTANSLTSAQTAINNVEACRTANSGTPNILIIFPAGSLFTGVAGLAIPQSSSSWATGFIAIISSGDASLPNGQMVCAHGMEDNLPTLIDIGIDNPDCAGDAMYYVLGTTQTTIPAGAFTLANGAATNTSAYNDVQYMWTVEGSGTTPTALRFCSPTSTGGSASAVPPCTSTTLAPDHWLIMDMEARIQAGDTTEQDIVSMPGASNETLTTEYPTHIHFRKDWVHGDWTTLAAGLNAIDNAFDITCSYCSILDSQTSQNLHPSVEGHSVLMEGPGPYKLDHNWFEGQSIGTMAGGYCALPSIAGFVPFNDVEIRRNRFTYPYSWLGTYTISGNAHWNGYLTYRKNAIEFKEGSRILRAGNIFENSDNSGQQDGIIGDIKVDNNSCSLGNNYQAISHDVTDASNIWRNGAESLETVQNPIQSNSMGILDSNGATLGMYSIQETNSLWYNIAETNYGSSSNEGISLDNAGYAWQGTAQMNSAGTQLTFTANCSVNLGQCPGQFLSATVTSAGTGCVSGGAITISAPNVVGGNQMKATTACSGGGISGVNLTGPGSGYTSVTATPVNGTGTLTINLVTSPTAPSLGVEVFDIVAGDPVQLTQCSVQTSFNQPTTLYNGTTYLASGSARALGAVAIAGTNPNSLTVTFPWTATANASDTAGYCKITNGQGHPLNFQWTHNTVISNSLFLLTGSVGVNNNVSGGPNFAVNGLYQNSIYVGAGGWNMGAAWSEGTSTENIMNDSSTLTADHLIWAGRTGSLYTFYGNNPNYPVASPIMWFPTSYCTGASPTSGCVGFIGAMSASSMPLSLADYHQFELISGSTFKAGGADPASDGTDMGVNIPALDTAQTQNLYVCGSSCGSPGPFPDNNSMPVINNLGPCAACFAWNVPDEIPLNEHRASNTSLLSEIAWQPTPSTPPRFTTRP